MFWMLIVLVILLKKAEAVIYSLNESEYARMPPLYNLDDYESCLLQPGGLYCVVDIDLFADGRSQLMEMIQEYSEHTMKHFNHSEIHRGVCVTRTCRNFFGNGTLNNTLQTCLNESLWKKYEIQGKLSNVLYCNKHGERISLDVYDILVAMVYLALVVINLIGSFYDVIVCKCNEKTGNPYLLAFSVRRNWIKLTAPSGMGPEPRLTRLKIFNGLRAMTIICVIFSHTVLVMSVGYVDNPSYIEQSYNDPLKQLLFNGSLVTFTFFVMSAFLLAYNFELHAEKQGVTWVQWPKGVFLRWIRLFPTYALVLATICTWMRHLGSGPMWGLLVETEAHACRQYWWAHLLYINNYIYDDVQCAPQTWYLAADTQLFCLGLVVCVFARTPRVQKVVLGLLFVVSLITPALQTYIQDLEAVVIQSPEAYRTLYAHNDTFRLLYARGHTSLSTYVLGLTGGLLAYRWQTDNKDLNKYKKYRWAFWMMFPLGVAVILSGGLFYMDGPRASLPVRVLYAALYKPLFQLLIVIFIVGTILKFEGVYRGVVEWRGFTWAGRVTYNVYLLHVLLQRGLIGSQATTTHMSDYYILMILSGSIFLTFLCAGALWVCVEAPVASLTKALFMQRRDDKTEGKKEGECTKV